MLNHVDWVGLSRFKSIKSQNTSQSRPIHFNPHGIKITEQGLTMREKKQRLLYGFSPLIIGNELRLQHREDSSCCLVGSTRY
jgi:hypothetical protein